MYYRKSLKVTIKFTFLRQGSCSHSHKYKNLNTVSSKHCSGTRTADTWPSLSSLDILLISGNSDGGSWVQFSLPYPSKEAQSKASVLAVLTVTRCGKRGISTSRMITRSCQISSRLGTQWAPLTWCFWAWLRSWVCDWGSGRWRLGMIVVLSVWGMWEGSDRTGAPRPPAWEAAFASSQEEWLPAAIPHSSPKSLIISLSKLCSQMMPKNASGVYRAGFLSLQTEHVHGSCA